MQRFGSREEVWDGTAERTRGGLTRDQLTLSRRGKIVSLRQSLAARQRFPRMVKSLCESRGYYQADAAAAAREEIEREPTAADAAAAMAQVLEAAESDSIKELTPKQRAKIERAAEWIREMAGAEEPTEPPEHPIEDEPPRGMPPIYNVGGDELERKLKFVAGREPRDSPLGPPEALDTMDIDNPRGSEAWQLLVWIRADKPELFRKLWGVIHEWPPSREVMDVIKLASNQVTRRKEGAARRAALEQWGSVPLSRISINSIKLRGKGLRETPKVLTADSVRKFFLEPIPQEIRGGDYRTAGWFALLDHLAAGEPVTDVKMGANPRETYQLTDEERATLQRSANRLKERYPTFVNYLIAAPPKSQAKALRLALNGQEIDRKIVEIELKMPGVV